MGTERKKYNPIIISVSSFIRDRYLNNKTRAVKSCSIQEAKNIGITFKATSKDELITIKKAIKYIADYTKSDITLLGYIPNKKPDDFYLTQKGITFISDKDLDFLYRPKTEITGDFIKTRFDILIDLGSKEYYPMDYVLRMSDASFKIGKFGENTPFDFMLNIDNNKGLDYFCDQVILYLSQIKSK